MFSNFLGIHIKEKGIKYKVYIQNKVAKNIHSLLTPLFLAVPCLALLVSFWHHSQPKKSSELISCIFIVFQLLRNIGNITKEKLITNKAYSRDKTVKTITSLLTSLSALSLCCTLLRTLGKPTTGRPAYSGLPTLFLNAPSEVFVLKYCFHQHIISVSSTSNNKGNYIKANKSSENDKLYIHCFPNSWEILPKKKKFILQTKLHIIPWI